MLADPKFGLYMAEQFPAHADATWTIVSLDIAGNPGEVCAWACVWTSMCIDMRTDMCTEYVDQSKTLEGRDQQREPRV